ncbi:heat-inducible transcriptional repressor HrcA [Arenicella xantha]|uniref:Heat-inducible transcription repressor HrcA n=1 Tax=Arenicella xantha TaxID=644221 RepID=A0A395JJX2_9GAMM|nr:heat-inducible transcriptional repressor HrcA [Arenicella xantha]RBP50819.1 heat-inducible transcription repressor HrcA [Arenicella xantha]
MSLDPRAENVLKNLVETYIQQGQPVGSRTLSKLPQLGVSSATVRNVMSDLEELGLITSPHTSAGRIPTAQGYRLFVDSMIKASPFTQSAIKQLTERFDNESDPDALLSHASDVLSELSHFAGVVVLPNHAAARFHQIEFMRLSEARVLAILVTEDGRVQNRVLPSSESFSDAELVEAANFFNSRYKGNTLNDVRRLLIEDMHKDNDRMHTINRTAMQAASRVISEEESDKNKKDVVLSGEQKLLDVPDLCQIETLQRLFDAFKTKRDLLDLLDRSLKAEGVSVFIGEESGYLALGECSVIASPYQVDGKVLGTLGVVGPTRMAYSEVISVVDITAKLLSQALTKSSRA